LLNRQGVKKQNRFERRRQIVNYESNLEEKNDNQKHAKSGSKLIHSRFGEGVIVAISGDIATIAFNAAHGIKKLDINHPSITLK
jgi:DNA helicase II / ATP-dependent DNA helicase PcrA